MNKLIVSGILPLMAGSAAFAAAGHGAAQVQAAGQLLLHQLDFSPEPRIHPDRPLQSCQRGLYP